jgi:NAD+ synthase
VVGLSGGVDSALVARLAADALGPNRVHAVLLPDRAMPAGLLAETRSFATSLGISHETYFIDGPEAAVRGLLPTVTDRVTWGNVKARIRMLLWYTLARERNLLVLGAGNKSELLMGYFTKWGDGGVDLLPIGDLYKTQVRQLGRELGLPPAILERVPSAGLWEGQSDEEELGIAYADLDRILLGLEQLRTEAEIAELTGLSPTLIEKVVLAVTKNRHKRRMPPAPKLGLRTIGIDWRD